MIMYYFKDYGILHTERNQTECNVTKWNETERNKTERNETERNVMYSEIHCLETSTAKRAGFVRYLMKIKHAKIFKSFISVHFTVVVFLGNSSKLKIISRAPYLWTSLYFRFHNLPPPPPPPPPTCQQLLPLIPLKALCSCVQSLLAFCQLFSV